MKKSVKKLISLLLAVIMIVAAVPMTSFAAKTVASGNCGDNAKWKLDSEGTLTISGTGYLDNYNYFEGPEPWEKYRKNVKKLIINEGITGSSYFTFSYCENLQSVELPKSLEWVGKENFGEPADLTLAFPNSSLKSIKVHKDNKNFCSVDGVLFNKDKTTLIQYPGGKTATSYEIPKTVTKIDDSAFQDSKNLKSVKIPSSVTYIGNSAFEGCSSLEIITIPKSVKTFGYWGSVFYGCKKLNDITLPNRYIEYLQLNSFIGTAYYNNKNNWKSGGLYLDNYLLGVEESTSGKFNVKSGTVYIADSAFYCCQEITSISIPNSVTKIGNRAFYACTDIKSIKIGNSVKSIGEVAFKYCEALTSLTIPDSVTKIENWQTFDGCSNLKTITIGNGLKSIGYSTFNGLESLESVKIGNGVKSIGYYAFSSCEKLKSVTLGSGVTKIAGSAFKNCPKLKKIAIPKSVESIGSKALGYYYDHGDKKVSGFTIEGVKGTAAETYAKKNGFTFVSHSKHTYETVTTTAATTSKNGTETTKCIICGNVKSKSTISKIKSVTLSNDTFTYNGKAKQPTVTVKDSKGNTLKKDTDYTVKYSSGRKNVGKYTVTVTFKGKYSGTKKLTFKIKPKSTSISKLTAGKKQFTATWYKRTEQTSGYQLEYSTSSSMKNASRKTYTTTSKNSRTITGLKSAKKYYVRIRTYKNVKIDGKTYKYYSAWSSVKSVKTK